MKKHVFPAHDPKQPIADQEKKILKYWQEKKIFQRSVESRNPAFTYKFFDGPPFATGTPHYGHILAGAIKDVIPRYKTMQGYRVERKWGWDCHGVPVEFQVEKEHQIGGKPGIEKMGVGKFNELCRSVVLRCADKWRETVARMGRFVDFENDYKTMQPEFMESVWWVFDQLWQKGLIYEGEKVVAYSPKLGSPLSNFEANLNYSDIDDPSVVAEFKLKDEENTYLLAWTTTPWTLPSNLGLCVNPKRNYAVVEKDGKKLVVIETLVEKFFGEDAEILKKIPGKNLVGKNYEPLFPFFKEHENAFQVLGDEFVSDSDGTGIVHMAPNFGEDDARICHENGIKYLSPNPLNDSGYFEHEKIPGNLNGLYFRYDPHVDRTKEHNANKWVINALKESGKLFEQKQIRHSYPHCWRTDCALMYRGIKTWFVNVQKIKEKMIAENQNINWLPEHLKNGRFGKMLESAPDWAISRNRYWGCPIPVWKCSVTRKVQVVSSRSQLEKLCGKTVDDLHKHFIDELTWKSPFHEDGIMERIEEVLDCWFESGSMPYGSIHYPFNQKKSWDYSAGNNELFAVRHGESTKNVPEQLCVRSKELSEKHPLTKKGELDAHEEAKKFPEKFDIIVTSPLLRAKQTADIFKEYNPKAEMIIEDQLIDFDHGTFEGKPVAEEAKWRHKNNVSPNEEFPKGESYLNMRNRIFETVKKYDEQFSGKKILYVSHGWPIDSLLDHRDGNQPKMHDNCCPNTTVFNLTQKNTEVSSPDKGTEGFDFQPADFIAEGLDQTRGWFYTLHVLGCALFGKNIYKNVITNGIILAEDGQKMSKSKKNYPDPNLIFEKYGADAMRFYLLSSPVVKGENFRFAERGVEEVLKSVILPLKSTYQFLSTYAKIDNWKPTKFIFVRHGEGDHNVAKIYSGNVENQHSLTNTGRSQIEDIAPFLPDFDAIITSPFKRTQETVEIIKNLRNFSGEVPTDKRVQEPYFGDLEGKPWISPLERYKNTSTEHPFQVQERVDEFMEDVSKSHRGQTVLVCSHGSPIRNAEAYQNHTKDLDELTRIPYAGTGKYRTIFAHPQTENELDLWILSELQTVVKNYRRHFDSYDLEGALRHIAPFIDNLNNWYLRRSRRRFWASGMDNDKVSGYETLHHVLLILSKVLAPVCPFFAEQLFQDLGGGGSVHLEYMPHANGLWINEAEQEKVSVTREIVSLAAGIRARAKVKLRQPLQKLSFSTTSEADIDLEIIKAEANVKDVEIIPEKKLKEFAQKIVRVNARMVGKKFGKKVQELIKAGKSGVFTEKADGVIEICGEELLPGEYEVGFITEEGVEAEATVRTVVLLDTEITEDLEIEGISRELIRSIQDLRKKSGFEIADRITVSYDTESEKIQKAFIKFETKISDETLTTNISQEKTSGTEIEIDEAKVNIELRKA